MKFKFLFFVAALVALIAFQSKVVMPFVYDIVASDLFLEESGDEANRVSSITQMTDIAFSQCNNHIVNEILPDHTTTFPKSPLNAFSLGNFRYVINADIDIQSADAASFTRRYVCRIHYNNDDNNEASNPDNWTIEGFSGLDSI